MAAVSAFLIDHLSIVFPMSSTPPPLLPQLLLLPTYQELSFIICFAELLFL